MLQGCEKNERQSYKQDYSELDHTNFDTFTQSFWMIEDDSLEKLLRSMNTFIQKSKIKILHESEIEHRNFFTC